MNKEQIIKLLKAVPTGNLPADNKIIAEALIYIIENKEKVSFT